MACAGVIVSVLLVCITAEASTKSSFLRRSIPVKPSLQSSFSADVTEETQSAAGVMLRTFRVAADSERLAAGYETWPQDGESLHPRYASLLDLHTQRRVESHGFFDELVCFSFDLEQGAPRLSAADSKRVFRQLLDAEILGVPLRMYETATEFLGHQQVKGQDCEVWSAENVLRRQLPSSEDALDGDEPFPEFASELAEQLSGSDGQLLLQTHAGFCVDTHGHLHAANVSSRAFFVPRSGPKRELGAMIRRLTLSAVPAADLKSTPLLPEHRAPGGLCVDLTSEASRNSELTRGLNDHERLMRINEESEPHWSAAAYEGWHGLNVRDLQLRLGAHLKPRSLPLRHRKRRCMSSSCSFDAEPMPVSFDARARWPRCQSIAHIPNQGSCGSCWAVSAAATLADRFCVAASAQNASRFSELLLSPQHLMDCGGMGNGCGGGELDEAWHFFTNKGLPAESCVPYLHCPDPLDAKCGEDGQDHERAEGCQDRCADGRSLATFRTSRVFAVAAPGDVLGMQQEMLSAGPINAAFFVFSDFFSYKNGTYFRTPAAFGPVGGHAVRIVGWGTDATMLDYWLIANSWGSSWGMRGFFCILRGSTECGIETMPAAGQPLLQS